MYYDLSFLPFPYLSPYTHNIIDKINDYGAKIGRNILEISLAWTAQRSQVGSVLVGATSPEQMIQNIDAISWDISEEQIKTIDEIVLG